MRFQENARQAGEASGSEDERMRGRKEGGGVKESRGEKSRFSVSN